jgi:hypothetical protein
MYKIKDDVKFFNQDRPSFKLKIERDHTSKVNFYDENLSVTEENIRNGRKHNLSRCDDSAFGKRIEKEMSTSRKRAYSRHLFDSQIKDVFDTRGMCKRSASTAKPENERDLFRSQIKANFNYENLDNYSTITKYGKRQGSNNMFTSQFNLI